MNDADLAALLAAPESDRVERKEAFTGSAKEKIYETICAFANDYPGHRAPGAVVVGQRDDGSFSKIPIDDRLISDLSQIRNNTKILPVPAISVTRHRRDGHEVAVIIVEPSSSPPVRYDGRTWIRTGSIQTIATYEQEQRLSERRRLGSLPFDAQPLPFVPLADIDFDYFRTTYLPSAVAREVLLANHREPREQMIGLRLLDPSGVPTALGVLLLGVDPQRWISGAYVQFLRHSGTEFTSPVVDQKRIAGRIVEMIRTTEQILDGYIRVSTRFADVELEQRTPDYPIVALRQIFRNAVMHRAYDWSNAPIRIHWFNDRIEIQNPGGPYGAVSGQNFGSGVTDYRNPSLAGALRDLEFVQQFGQGLHIAQTELAANGSPPLEWDTQPTTTMVRIRSRQP